MKADPMSAFSLAGKTALVTGRPRSLAAISARYWRGLGLR